MCPPSGRGTVSDMAPIPPDTALQAGGGPIDPLLAPRFEVPARPRTHVRRPRLEELLDRGSRLPLTLVCAPAGNGKTTLVAAWAAHLDARAAVVWITLETADATPERFWPVVRAGLRRHGCVDTRDPTPHDDRPGMLAELGAALATCSPPVTLVLDDYGVVGQDVSDEVDFLLRHSGHGLHLVVLTRCDPPLPLHRYRLTDTIAEIRTSDLAFTVDETAQLLDHSGLSLGPAAVAALTGRARGWAAGLRLASMRLEHCTTPGDAVGSITGETGDVAAYLRTEVLRRQPPQALDLLLRTSVVDVLRPGLVEELGGPGATRWLGGLPGSDLPAEPVDDHPGWYRLHPFLLDLLRAELAHRSPRLRARLHRKAARWLADHGALRSAVALAATAGSWREASGYVVEGLAVGEVLLDHGPGSLAGMLRAVPGELADPAACVVRATLALSDRDPDRCAEELKRGRDGLALAPSGDDRAAAVSADLLDAVRAEMLADPEAVMLAERAEAGLVTQDPARLAEHPELRAVLLATKGRALMHAGALADAREALEAGLGVAVAPGCTPLVQSCLGRLAMIAAFDGRLRQARELATRSLALAEHAGTAVPDRCPSASVALAWTDIERYDVPSAREQLRAARRARTLAEDRVAAVMAALVQSRLLRAGGDPESAITVLEDVAADAVSGAGWLADRVEVETAALHLGRGDVDAAERVLDRLANPDGALGELARGQLALAHGDGAVAGARAAHVLGRDSRPPLQIAVGAHLLAAGCQLAEGDRDRARTALVRALRLAAPEALRRPFREAPADLREPLDSDAELAAHRRWLGSSAPRRRVGTGQRTRAARLDAPPDELIDPLTAKETEVLGHLSDLLSTEEIADTMFVSVNTVRTHVRGILRKLGVSRRTDAVRRARALHLIDS